MKKIILSFFLITIFFSAAFFPIYAVDYSNPFEVFKELVRGLFSVVLNIQISPYPTGGPYPTLTPPVSSITPGFNYSIYELIDAVRTNCSYNGIAGSISQYNRDCLNPTPTLAYLIATKPIDSRAKQHLYGCVDPADMNFEFLQCVCFARASVAMTKGVILDRTPSALAYTNNPPTGYTYISKLDSRVQNGSLSINIGDLLIWSFPYKGADNFGHIAYVANKIGESTNAGERYFILQIAEANWDLKGTVQIRPDLVATDNQYIQGWLTPI